MTQEAKKRKTGRDSDEHPPKRSRGQDTSPLSQSFHNEENVAGKIKKIFMKNFMCHEAMEIELNSKVNFIVGRNGSGKSAILTALTVGLGARANVTSRGTSIKEFVKKGKASASVEITISNQGPLAFKHEIYGDSIVIVRNIGASSNYKIKNWRGDTISNKRDELEQIVSALNIQVENPISVLNQDVSRTFLVTSGPENKYDLFMKATRLDAIKTNYSDALNASTEARQRLCNAKKLLDTNHKKIEDLQNRLKMLESIEESRKDYDLLQNEMHWAKAIAEEKKLLRIDGNIESTKEQERKLMEIDQNRTDKEQDINKQIDVLQTEIKSIETEAASSSTNYETSKARYLEEKKLHEGKKNELRAVLNNKKRKEDEVKEMKAEIKRLEEINSKAGSMQHEARQKRAKLEQDLDELEAALRTKQTDQMHFEEDKRRLVQEEHLKKIEVDSKNNVIRKIRHQLSALKNQSDNALTVYGPNMPRLLKRIEEEYQKGKFRQKPRGPIGAYIKVKDSAWIPAVEAHLGSGTLMTFCVDNTEDAKIMSIIMKEVFHDDQCPQLSISKFFHQVHDVSRHCARSPNYCNMFDALEISDPVVANALIDMREIECILLISTSQEACQIMNDYRRVPVNCKRAITQMNDLFFPDPNYRSYGGDSHLRARFLQVSTSQAIENLEEELGVAEEEKYVKETDHRHVREKMQCTQKELQAITKIVTSLLTRQAQYKDEIDRLKDICEPTKNDPVAMFIQDVQAHEEKIAKAKVDEERLIEDVRKSLQDLEDLKDEVKRNRDFVHNIDEKLNPIKEQIRNLNDEKRRMQINSQGSTRRIKEAQMTLQKLTAEHDVQQRAVNKAFSVAQSKCERIETDRSEGEISALANELMTRIRALEQQNGNKEDLSEELAEKQAKFDEVKEFTDELESANNKHIKRLTGRQKLFHEMKREITAKVQLAFTNILRLRNYKGQIKIDHSHRTLDLEVSPVNDAKRSTNDARSLSGGERSYSTVAFILALWECTELPFYFLDEFDVFMDKVNRRVIMDILIDHAKTHPQSQFGFLTPLDASNVQADSDISIHRLAPPERSE